MSESWVLQFAELWNEVAKPVGMRGCVPRLVFDDPKRRALVKACHNLHPDLEDWQEAFEALAANPFYCGQNDRGWRGSIDYVIRPTKRAAVLEGGILRREEREADEARKMAKAMEDEREDMEMRERMKRGEF